MAQMVFGDKVIVMSHVPPVVSGNPLQGWSMSTGGCREPHASCVPGCRGAPLDIRPGRDILAAEHDVSGPQIQRQRVLFSARKSACSCTHTSDILVAMPDSTDWMAEVKVPMPPPEVRLTLPLRRRG